MEYTCKHM